MWLFRQRNRTNENSDISNKCPFAQVVAGSRFLQAAKNGNMEGLEREYNSAELLQPQYSVCGVDQNGNTPLHLAVHAGQAEVVHYLLERGGPVHFLNNAGLSPLDSAARWNRVACLKLLLNYMMDEANVSFVSRAKDSFLSTIKTAAEFGHVECVLALLDIGAGYGKPVDYVGLALSNRSRAENCPPDAIYPACYLDGWTDTGEEVCNHRLEAVVCIQQWWRSSEAKLLRGQCERAATKIQMWYRKTRTVQWLKRALVSSNKDIDTNNVERLFDSDDNLDAVEAIVNAIPDFALKLHDAWPEKLGSNDPVADKGPTFPRFLRTVQYNTSHPLVVRSKPLSTAPIVGLLGHPRIVQTYKKAATDTDPTVHETCTDTWVRLSNPNHIFGFNQAWCLQNSAGFVLLREVSAFGASVDGKTGLVNGGNDEDTTTTVDMHRFVTVKSKKNDSPLDIVELGIRAYKGHATGVIRILSGRGLCLKHLCSHPPLEKQMRLGKWSLLSRAAFDNNVEVLRLLLERNSTDVLSKIAECEPSSPLLLACATNSTEAAKILISHLTESNPSHVGLMDLEASQKRKTYILNEAMSIALVHHNFDIICALADCGCLPENALMPESVWHDTLRATRTEPPELKDFAESLSDPLKGYVSTSPLMLFFCKRFCSRSTDQTLLKSTDIDQLQELGTAIDSAGENGITLLMQSLALGDVELAVSLLERGASDAIPDIHGRSAWWHAAHSGCVNSIKVLREFNITHAHDVLTEGNLVLAQNQSHDELTYSWVSPIWAVIGQNDLDTTDRPELETHNNRLLRRRKFDDTGIDILDLLFNYGFRVSNEWLVSFTRKLINKKLATAAAAFLCVESARLMQSVKKCTVQRHRLEQCGSDAHDPLYNCFKDLIETSSILLDCVRLVHSEMERNPNPGKKFVDDVAAIYAMYAGETFAIAMGVEFIRLNQGRQSRFIGLSTRLLWEDQNAADTYCNMIFGRTFGQSGCAQYITKPAGGMHDWQEQWIPSIIKNININVLTFRWKAFHQIIEWFDNRAVKLECLTKLAIRLQSCSKAETDLTTVVLANCTDKETILKDQQCTNKTLRSASRNFVNVFFPEHAIKCGICLGPMVDVTPCCHQTGGEHYKKVACDHEYCLECLKSWTFSQLHQSSAHINCPHERCAFVLNGEDVQRIAGEEALNLFIEIGSKSFRARLNDFSLDPSTNKWVNQNTRLCPSCNVIIERSAGCNSMKCFTCGNRFSWNEAPKLAEVVQD